MKKKLVLLLCNVFIFQLFSIVIAADRKVDENGNEYFVVTSDELEAKNKKAPMARVPTEPSYKEIALEMKSGCTAVSGDIGKAGAAAVDLGDFFVVIPTIPNGLPPHPGENGKLTIQGVDSDNDCVRDDIEHFIARRFKEEHQTEIRKYLFEYAIWLDFFLIQGLSENNGRTTYRELAKVGSCLSNLIGFGESNIEVNALFAEFHNTFDRSYRYANNLHTIAGWTTREVIDAQCS